MDLLPCVEIAASTPRATAAVIWLHGLGADGHDFEPLVPYLGLDHARFVFPNAPPIPVTLNHGWVMPAWYDILHLGRGPGRENEADVRISAGRVGAIIAREVERGIPTDRIVLAGFSQGAAMALYVGARYPEPLAGIVALSGYLVADGDPGPDANAATPMFFGHGTRDDVVPVEGGRQAYERFRPGREAVWAEYPMGHEVDGPEILALRRWLHERLPA